ncbi:hypothetical protein SCHPADRAFT_132020 [Schizopora paradoxa]|uniref:Zinc finger PHD-type domain-containing protein n=1 Tax=Schizopora paradoxa TaxID=27342 RepID=A0A0H2S1F6_9AGAM|nr:hypothetical protein SCHPADRAFT_132020 [Schizopora paradoxa]
MNYNDNQDPSRLFSPRQGDQQGLANFGRPNPPTAAGRRFPDGFQPTGIQSSGDHSRPTLPSGSRHSDAYTYPMSGGIPQAHAMNRIPSGQSSMDMHGMGHDPTSYSASNTMRHASNQFQNQYPDDQRGRQPNTISSMTHSQQPTNLYSSSHGGGSSGRHLGMDDSHVLAGYPPGTNAHGRNDSVASDPHGIQNYPLSAPIRSESYSAMQLDQRDSDGSRHRNRSATMPVVQQHASQSQIPTSVPYDPLALPSYSSNPSQGIRPVSSSAPVPSTLSAPATSSASATMVCNCGLPYVDGRLIQCITCVQTFHMTCCHIHANNPASWKCWMCFSPNSAAPKLHSTIPSGTNSAPGMSVPSTSMPTSSISSDRDRNKPRHDVSPHPPGSHQHSTTNSSNRRANDIVEGSYEGSRQYRPTAEGYHTSSSSHVPPQPPPISSTQSLYPSQSGAVSLSSKIPNGYSSASASWNASGVQSSSSHPAAFPERPPPPIRAGTLPPPPLPQTTTANRPRNPNPCGYCQEHRIRVRRPNFFLILSLTFESSSSVRRRTSLLEDFM